MFKLKNIKTAHLQQIVNNNADKPRTTNIFKLTVSQMFNQAVINDLVVKNPALGITLPTVNKKQGKRAFSEEETNRIKSLDLDPRTKCLIFLLLYTGMRRGEVLALTKNDINFDTREITVDKTLIFKKNISEIKPFPKTKSSVRKIPLLDALVPVLADYINNLVNTDYLFTTKYGDTVSLVSFRRTWQKFEQAIGTKEITPHIFRHNFATMLYNAGVEIKSAQTILGHSSINVTMDIYTHLGNLHNEIASQKLNAYIM